MASTRPAQYDLILDALYACYGSLELATLASDELVVADRAFTANTAALIPRGWWASMWPIRPSPTLNALACTGRAAVRTSK